LYMFMQYNKNDTPLKASVLMCEHTVECCLQSGYSI
jgi:hypothetical protein